jgi:phosphoglycerate dehydrogenase-like enzyme
MPPPPSPSLRLVCLSTDDSLRAALEEEFAAADTPDAVSLVFADPRGPSDALAAVLADADGVLCGAFPPELRALSPALRWVQFWSAGVDGRLYPELFDGGVQVTTGSGIHAASCSEHILALMLAFARGLPQTFAAQQARDWSQRRAIADACFELEGRTVGIVGAGQIGQAIGKRCHAFGMRTVGTRRDPSRPTPGIDVLLSHIQYHDLILASDFIVLALPLTASTRMIFGEDEIEILRKGTYLFNIGRGGLMDERWVVKALENRWLAGAGLDVFADEPLPSDSPFWSLSNCIVTPHVGGVTPRYWPRFARLVREQAARLISGAPLENRVDKDLGY